jgi:hypothetical protein
MKHIAMALGMVCLSNWAIAQTKGTWQQEVNYTLKVTLDDQSHMLRGSEEFVYTNNSPNTLEFIYIHLWPNAYKNKHTALARQLMMSGKDYLFRNDPEYQGFIDSLNFEVGGISAQLTYDAKHIDIAKLTLPKPLAPGEKVVVKTPFRVKLPSGQVSRMGHIDQTYQITQWYPKPAVYDEAGWHPMPYLNQGEFYSEYGTFDVSITLPENYTVGATGDLQTEREIKRLNLLAEYNGVSSRNPDVDWSNIDKHYENSESSRVMKTLRYTQSRVHDFAWFADKSFRVLKGEVILPQSGRTVTTWAMYTENSADFWKPHSLEYLHDGILKYSQWNGDYPYNQVTAVDGTISAGGGMEYPNVTVIGNVSTKEELEVVIVHEVGHNWFYGILGSNERDFGWMDEGLNTLNEMRFVAEKYPENTRLSDADGALGFAKKLGFVGLSHKDEGDVLYRCMASFGVDQPIHTHSADFSQANYGGVMYQKTGLVFHYLKAYLGDSLFDLCMHTYFDRWKFRHPQPEDFRVVMEEVSKQNLGWLFDDLIETRKVADFKLVGVKKTGTGMDVTVINVGSVNGPIGVQSIRNGKVLESVWVSPAELKKAASSNYEGSCVVKLSTLADTVMIDADRNIPEVNRNNNMWTEGGREFKWKFGTGNDLPNERNHYWLPAVGWNQYDRMMLGLVLHNTSLPAPRFRYSLVPMYSFGRKNLSGLGDISYNPQGGKRYKSLRIGVSAMTFQNNTTWLDSLGDNSFMHPGFTVIKPYAIMELGSAKRRKGFTHFLEATGLINWQGRHWAPFNGPEQSEIERSGLRINYFGAKRGPVSVFEYKTSFESVSQVSHIITSVTGRVQVEAKYTWNYIAEKKKARSIELRGYWGKVGPLNYWIAGTSKTENMYLMLSGASGQQDVFYDEYFRGRNSAPTFGNNSWMGQYDFASNGQQRMNNMGGMGTATFMGSRSSLAAINFSMSLPKVPGFIRVFADYASMPNPVFFSVPEALPWPTQFFDAGLMIRTGFLQVSVPLFMNNDLLKTLGGIEEVGGPGGIKQYVLPTYKQQLQRGIRFSLNIPLNSGLFLRKSLLSAL